MTTTEQTPRELPELPVAFDRLPCEPDDDMIDVFTPTQMHAYARQAIAEYEARATRDAAELAKLRQLCRDMLPVFQAARPLVLNLERLKDAAIAQGAKHEK